LHYVGLKVLDANDLESVTAKKTDKGGEQQMLAIARALVTNPPSRPAISIAAKAR
jgi:hypothetical protein